MTKVTLNMQPEQLVNSVWCCQYYNGATLIERATMLQNKTTAILSDVAATSTTKEVYLCGAQWKRLSQVDLHTMPFSELQQRLERKKSTWDPFSDMIPATSAIAPLPLTLPLTSGALSVSRHFTRTVIKHWHSFYLFHRRSQTNSQWLIDCEKITQ